MKLVVLLVVMFGVCAAAPQQRDGDASIISEHREDPDADSWKWGFAADNGISREESGSVSDDGPGGTPTISVKGSYTWTTPDGTTYGVTYTAGRHGYHTVMKPLAGSRRQRHRLWDLGNAATLS